MRRVAKFVLLGWGALCLPSCTKHFYSLHTEYSSAATASSAPTVVASPTFAAVEPQIDTIALRPDSECHDYSTAEASGRGAANDRIMSIACGTTMAALERAFAAQGYRVVYWSAIERLSGERQAALIQQRAERIEARRSSAGVDETVDDSETPMGTLLPEAVAIEMGVDALVTVNSAEFLTSVFSPDATWNRQYYYAEASGRETGRAGVPAALADVFDAYLEANEQGISTRQVPTASIDMTVQHLRTNESLFFYSWIAVASWNDSDESRFFVRCERHRSFSAAGRGYYCVDRIPTSILDQARASRNGSTDRVLVDQQFVNRDLRTWTTLLDRIAVDAAARFRNGGREVPGPVQPVPSAAAPLPTSSAPPTPPATTPNNGAPAWLNR